MGIHLFIIFSWSPFSKCYNFPHIKVFELRSYLAILRRSVVSPTPHVFLVCYFGEVRKAPHGPVELTQIQPSWQLSHSQRACSSRDQGLFRKSRNVDSTRLELDKADAGMWQDLMQERAAPANQCRKSEGGKHESGKISYPSGKKMKSLSYTSQKHIPEDETSQRQKKPQFLEEKEGKSFILFHLWRIP